MTERTKGEWEICNDFEIWCGDILIADLAPEQFGADSSPENVQEIEANARFICKAVNSHDELVEALELARRRINVVADECADFTLDFIKAELVQIDTVLARVK